MHALPVTRHDSVRLVPDPRRVIVKPFLPREEIYPDGSTRMQLVLDRIIAMPEADVADVLTGVYGSFDDRHRDLDGVVDRNVELVADRFDHLDHLGALGDTMSTARRRLIGAYFSHEYSISAAALGNPSMVPAPDQSGLEPGAVRFVLSLRAIGEGHVSSIEFRSGVVGADTSVRLDPPSRYATTGTTAPDSPDDTTLGPAGYRVSFPPDTELSERVLFPSDPIESHGMEDARFVRFVDDGQATYYATYTAFDGHQILPRLLQTDDFGSFRVSTLSGPAARNKGIALFPRKISGRFVALGRHDNVNNYVMTSTDVHTWGDVELIQEPSRPWELMQLGNCGSPLETEAGWLVVTHGVGPLRQYSLGALLLDLDDPCRVVGHSAEPLLVPTATEREGYVPNVVYSCGSMLHGDQLILPYGFADVGASIATIALDEVLDRLTN